MADTGNKPLRLKDLLELDCDSCSAAGFRCYPRRLGEPSPAQLSFCRSPAASSLRRSSTLSHISRSLSRRLRGRSFWWRRRSHDDEEELDAAVRGCGSELDSSSSGSSGTRTRRSRSESDPDFSSPMSSASAKSMHAAVATAGDEHEDPMKKMRAAVGEEGSSSSGSEADDKEEQLSPVAVMDFPCFDDDCSPSSDGCLPLRLVQTGGRQQAHKIRRLGSLDDELGLVGLETRLAGSSDSDDHDDDHVPARQLQCHAAEATPPRPSSYHLGAGVHDEPGAKGLLALLMDTVSAGMDVVSERLLLDFFVEMNAGRRFEERAGILVPGQKAEVLGGEGEILTAASGWLLDDAGAERERWGLEEVLRGGEAVIAEMERGRRWMQVGEEEREVGKVVAGVLTEQLVDEVIRDLLV